MDGAKRAATYLTMGDRVPPLKQSLDDLASLARHLCDTPIALISLAGEAPSDTSFGPFAPFAIAQRDLFIVPDASADDRFAGLPIVTGGEHIRFYAGAPLVTPDGQALGTLCVMDRVPRRLAAAQQDALRVLCRQVTVHLELRRQTRELFDSEALLRTLITGQKQTDVATSRLATATSRLTTIVEMEAVGRLAGRVAHDFNNALTTILGYSELLLTGRRPDDPERADIIQIQRAGDSAAHMTAQLLAFSRKQIVVPTPLDLNDVVSGMLASLEPLVGEAVKVVVSHRATSASIVADRRQVEQVIMNLAVNARDAMPHGGRLTIETANVELGVDVDRDDRDATAHPDVTPGPHVLLTVTDTGAGMTPEVQAHLFEPFFTTKEVGEGTGLGMATVQGIVVRSGGSIGVYSEVGRGTSVKVYWPRADRTETAGEPATAARVRSGAETVVVVEGAEVLRELARRLLERHGYAVLVAANADEALRLFERHATIDVLLTDLSMPGPGGLELTRALAERRPELKVIYMCGYTEDAVAHHALLQPGVALLHKPFSPEALVRVLREVLDR